MVEPTPSADASSEKHVAWFFFGAGQSELFDIVGGAGVFEARRVLGQEPRGSNSGNKSSNSRGRTATIVAAGRDYNKSSVDADHRRRPG